MKDSLTTLFGRPKKTGPDGVSGHGAKGALPDWLQVPWLLLSPFGVAFAGRIAWEKTVWTVVRGPQMVGFSLMHIHPGFFFAGSLSAGLLMLWLIPAVAYALIRREFIRAVDIVMVFVALFVTVAMWTPDTFFASQH